MAEILERQYLTFGIDGDIFGVPVTKVREVLEYIKPTKLPRTAEYLKGLINIRGIGIPVVDLRCKFGFPEIELTRDTSILVIEVESRGKQIMIGAITDEVYEVINLDGDQLEAPPHFGSRVDLNFIKNVGKREDKFIIILDMDKAFSDEEAGKLGEVIDAKSSQS